jgi:hypothetical protein
MGTNCYVNKLSYIELVIDKKHIINFIKYLNENKLQFIIGHSNKNIDLLSLIFLNVDRYNCEYIYSDIKNSQYGNETYENCIKNYMKYILLYNKESNYINNIVDKMSYNDINNLYLIQQDHNKKR